MRVISIDLGWRTLAFAKLTVSFGEMHELIEWDVVDIINDDAININKSTLELLISRATPKLISLCDVWIPWLLEEDGVVFLESQPLGPMACNVKTKTLSHILQAFFQSRGVRVSFVSPKLKLRGMESTKTATGTQYAANKKFSVERVKSLITESWLHWFESKAKRDDLADAFLQGLYAANEELAQRKKPKKRCRDVGLKEKRDAHKIAAASVSEDF